jgi:hypothetical protein
MIIYVCEATKQDRLSMKILNGLAGMIKAAHKGMSYNDSIKNGLGYDNLLGVIDFGISEGAFMPSYTLRDWLINVKYFFDNPPPKNILEAIYKELQKYPQGSIRGHR